MKKKIILSVLLLTALTVCRGQQVKSYGSYVGLGYATINDDLFRNSPILSYSLGGFCNWDFFDNLPWMSFALRTDFQISRRGGNFCFDFPSIESSRQGYYRGTYLSLPVLANLEFFLPFSEYKSQSQYGILRLGPTLNLAMFGRLHDEQHCSTNDSPLINYNRTYTSFKGTFDHIRRFDIGLQLAVGYKYGSLSLDLVWDFGLIPIRPVEETLFYVDVEPASREIMQTTPYIPNPTGNMGTLNRMSLNFGYEIPVVRSSYHRGHHR